MNVPEPDGWELLRAIQAEHERIDQIFEDFISRETSDAENELLASRIEANAERISRQYDALGERVKNLEDHKTTSATFRRSILIAVMTSVIAALTTIIITIIHVYG